MAGGPSAQYTADRISLTSPTASIMCRMSANRTRSCQRRCRASTSRLRRPRLRFGHKDQSKDKMMPLPTAPCIPSLPSSPSTLLPATPSARAMSPRRRSRTMRPAAAALSLRGRHSRARCHSQAFLCLRRVFGRRQGSPPHLLALECPCRRPDFPCRRRRASPCRTLQQRAARRPGTTRRSRNHSRSRSRGPTCHGRRCTAPAQIWGARGAPVHPWTRHQVGDNHHHPKPQTTSRSFRSRSASKR